MSKFIFWLLIFSVHFSVFMANLSLAAIFTASALIWNGIDQFLENSRVSDEQFNEWMKGVVDDE